MRKTVSILLALLLMISLLPANVRAAETVDEGVCGEGLTWMLDDNGTLTISGEGEIEDRYFEDDERIKYVIVGDGVTGIGDRAFEACSSMTSVTIGKGVKTIGQYAFWGCYHIKDIYISDLCAWLQIKTIDLSSLPNYYSATKKNLYLNGELVVDLVIPEGIDEIPQYAFYQFDRIKSVSFANSVTTIADAAFFGTGLTDLVIPETVTSVGQEAFRYCNDLVSATIPASISCVSKSMFFGCYNLQHVTIPNGISKIENGAFYDCKKIKNITIPATVISIGKYAFSGCKGMESIVFTGDAPTINEYAFASIPTNVYYPETCSSWAVTVTQHYYGTITWSPYSSLEIIGQPQIGYGQLNRSASVAVCAVGDGLQYAWYVKNTGDNDYVLSDTDSNIYTTSLTEDTHGAHIYCVITDRNGYSVTTETTCLWMGATIVREPVSITVGEGTSARVTVQAIGDGLTYRWYYKDSGEINFRYTSTYKTKTYSLPMNEARNGRMVYCRVYDQYGNMVQSQAVTLSMADYGIRIIQQLESVTVAEGEMATVTVQAVGDGLIYRWYYKNPGETKYTYTSTYKGSTYKVPMNEARDGRQVLCRVYDKYGNVVQTNTVILKMS